MEELKKAVYDETWWTWARIILIANMHKNQSNCKAKDGDDHDDLYDDEYEEHDTDGGDGDDNNDI